MHIVIVCGTNRAGALSLKLSQKMHGLYEAGGHSCDLIDLAELPASALAPDAYKNPDAAITALVERFCAADGVHWVVPEYNGGFPGVLKLFIDMLPYPEGLDGRPCAFVGLSAGQFKGLRPVEHLQQVCGYRNAYIFPRRLFIGDSFKAFADEGHLTGDLDQRLEAQCEQFAAFAGGLKGSCANEA